MDSQCIPLRLHAPNAISGTPERHDDHCSPPTLRGVGWVLQWAAALAVLGWAALMLLTLGQGLLAEQALARAATAGAREAALPRATSASIEQAVRRNLADYRRLADHTTILVQQNGKAVRGAVRHRTGDRLSVAVAVPREAVFPPWLQVCLPSARVTEWTIEAPLLPRH